MSRSAGLLSDLLSRVALVGRSMAAPADLPLGDRCAALMSGRGEATELALARGILDAYAKLDSAARTAFFAEIKTRFGVDRRALEQALDTWRTRGDEDSARALHHACEPRTQELIRLLNRAPGATKDIVNMRADLLKAMRGDRSLASLDTDFRHLLRSWFNRGFLELRRIDWNTPAAILEKIIRYEAVHEINGWDDLRRRTAAADRRLYGFFHPAMRDEPLIFVEVALTAEIPGAIGPILAETRTPLDPRAAKVAVFYSISNCQAGLGGVSFGNFLIKQVVEELQSEFGTLETFVTLSPVPGFRRWAEAEAAKGAEGMLSEAERGAIRALSPVDGSIDAAATVAAVDALAGIAARYLAEAKSARGGPVDPVARFHLGNGARLERINLGADMSGRGLTNGWGVMVNYLYDLSAIERNHEAFAAEGTVICAPAVRRLVRQ